MAYELVPAGKYVAKITAYGLEPGRNEGDPPRVAMKLEFNQADGQRRVMTWRGGLGEGKPRKFTIDTLMDCGFKADDLGILMEGPASGALDMDSEVEIVVAHSVGKDGKTYANVKYINKLGGGAKFEEIKDKQGVKVTLDSMKGDLMAAAAEKGVTLSHAKPKAVVADDLPF